MSSSAQPGDNTSLRALLKVGHGELGKSVRSRENGILIARKGDELTDRGCRKKRMPSYNEMDRVTAKVEIPDLKKC